MKLTSKYFDRIRVKPDAEAKSAEQRPVCAWPGCSRPAPIVRRAAANWRASTSILCIDHVREYNKTYNYFEGLDNAAVSSWQKDALTGHRPTWRLGENSWASQQGRPQVAGRVARRTGQP